MTRAFASSADDTERAISFEEMAPGCYAFTAEGDPNTGVIVGDDSVLVVDAQATPTMAEVVIERIRGVTDKPIRYLLLTHYHAVRTLGASAYGADQILATDLTRRLIAERGEADRQSELARFPRLFRGAESIPGLTWPTLTFTSAVSVWLGNREVRLIHLGRAHTKGDVLAWVPDAGVMFAGDTVEHGTACYCGDAHLKDWPNTLSRVATFKPKALLPGRGKALAGAEVGEAIDTTRDFVSTLFATAQESVEAGEGLGDAYRRARSAMDGRFGDFALYDHTMPFNVARALDEAQGIDQPRVWTADRDREVWEAVEGEGGDAAPSREPSPQPAAEAEREPPSASANGERRRAAPRSSPRTGKDRASAPTEAAPAEPSFPEQARRGERDDDRATGESPSPSFPERTLAAPAVAAPDGLAPMPAESIDDDGLSAAIAAATADLMAAADRAKPEAPADGEPSGEGFAAWSERVDKEGDAPAAATGEATDAPDAGTEEPPPFSIDFDQLEEELRAITSDRRR